MRMHWQFEKLPAFLRRGGCEADGAVGNEPRSAPFDRCATRAFIRKLRDIVTNHSLCFALSRSRYAPVCSAEEASRHRLVSQPPLLKNGGEFRKLQFHQTSWQETIALTL